MLEIKTEQAMKLIENFKTGIKPQNNALSQERLVEADSIQLDSSIFIVEATLNYDFDYNDADTSFNTLLADTSEFTIPITKQNLKVNSDDLEGAYLQLHQYIESLIGDRVRVSVIDLEAFVSNNQVYYRAVIIRNYYWQTVKDCTPFQQSEYADEVCHANSAVSKIEYKLLNCNYVPCPSTWYSNVTSFGINNYSNLSTLNNILYFNSPLTNANQNFCDYTMLSINQLNSYVTNIYNYLNGVKPVGSNVVSLDLWSLVSPNNPIGPTYAWSYWGINVTFGQPSYQGC